MSEQKTVLKIKFIALTSNIVMEILVQDDEALGANQMFGNGNENGYRQEFVASNGYKINVGQGMCDPDLSAVRLLFRGSRNLAYCVSVLPTENIKYELERISTALIEFAKNNAFLGQDKPVPRIEQRDHVSGSSETLYEFYPTIGHSSVFNQHEMQSLRKLFGGNKFPIYKPEPRFHCSWIPVTPFTLSTGHLPMGMIESEAVRQINEIIQRKEIPETWIFEMKEETV